VFLVESSALQTGAGSIFTEAALTHGKAAVPMTSNATQHICFYCGQKNQDPNNKSCSFCANQKTVHAIFSAIGRSSEPHGDDRRGKPNTSFLT
jgi:hypothetical protein